MTRRFIERAFPFVEKHFHFMESMANNRILDYGIGDWCAPFDGPAISVNMESFKAPRALTDTLCFYEAAVILGKMCVVLGRENPYQKKQAANPTGAGSAFCQPLTGHRGRLSDLRRRS